MPIDPSLVRTYPDRLQTDNKIEMESGDYEVTIHDVFQFYVDADGMYQRQKNEDTTEERCRFTVKLDGSDVVLKDEGPMRVGNKTWYAKRLNTMAGVSLGDREAQVAHDAKKLVGFKGIASIEFAWKRRKTGDREEYPWTSITDIRPREVQIKKPQPVRSNALPAELRKPADDNFPTANDAPFDEDEPPF